MFLQDGGAWERSTPHTRKGDDVALQSNVSVVIIVDFIANGCQVRVIEVFHLQLDVLEQKGRDRTGPALQRAYNVVGGIEKNTNLLQKIPSF